MRSVTDLLDQKLPTPPEALRRGPFEEGVFDGPARSERTTTLLGLALAIAFGVCFVTGLLSHFIQQPPFWFWWPAHPAGLYRFTQGLHVATGLATIPLLLGKLWAVYPKFFSWPPTRDVAHAISRLGLLVLVGSTIFQLLSGLVNIARWYTPMRFFFTDAHYWTAWISVGAILVHVAFMLPRIRRGLNRAGGPPAPDRSTDAPGLGRRGFLAVVGTGAGVVTLATVGQTVPWLAGLSVLAPRDPRVGPQGLPVNKTAASARVTESAVDPSYALQVEAEGGASFSLTLAELQALPQHTVDLPIACVEGWSAMATWTGVRVRDVLAAAGLEGATDRSGTLAVGSLQRNGRYRASQMPLAHAGQDDTLLALRLGGEVLDVEHGFPVRLIAPNRPGVLQTKWVSTLTVQGES